MNQDLMKAEPSLLPYPITDMEVARAAVVARVRALTDATVAGRPGWQPPPFDPEYSAELLNIPVVFTHRVPGWDALLVPTPRGAQIICSDTGRSPGRVRFSLAHEIIHTFFENRQGVYHMRTDERHQYVHSPQARALERLCDLGAAELLMPMPEFGKDVEARGCRAASVAQVAARYEVSMEAAAVRMVETADYPVAIGFFSFAAQPSAASAEADGRRARPRRDAYRARRVFSSPGFPLLFPPGKSVPDSSTIYRSSTQFDELQAVEEFSLGKIRATLHLSAFPLHHDRTIVEPPVVCAVFQPIERTPQ